LLSAAAASQEKHWLGTVAEPIVRCLYIRSFSLCG
jgi:hypothetical protein